MKIVLLTIVAMAFGSILPPSGYGSNGLQRFRERKLSPYQLQRGKFKMQFNRSNRGGRINVRGMRHGLPLME